MKMHQARDRDTIHFHSYSFVEKDESWHVKFANAESMSAIDFRQVMGLGGINQDAYRVISNRILERIKEEYRYLPVIQGNS
jgi:hypothetical protein